MSSPPDELLCVRAELLRERAELHCVRAELLRALAERDWHKARFDHGVAKIRAGQERKFQTQSHPLLFKEHATAMAYRLESELESRALEAEAEWSLQFICIMMAAFAHELGVLKHIIQEHSLHDARIQACMDTFTLLSRAMNQKRMPHHARIAPIQDWKKKMDGDPTTAHQVLNTTLRSLLDDPVPSSSASTRPPSADPVAGDATAPDPPPPASLDVLYARPNHFTGPTDRTTYRSVAPRQTTTKHGLDDGDEVLVRSKRVRQTVTNHTRAAGSGQRRTIWSALFGK